MRISDWSSDVCSSDLAHAHWWDFIAPQLTHHYHVAAIDLSGHGDSGHRDAYAMEQWAREVLHVAGALGMDRPITVGHSMGGFVTLLKIGRASCRERVWQYV